MSWNRQPLQSFVSRTSGDGISLAEAKLFLRVDHSTENDLIEALITASRIWVERYLRRSLLTETYDFKFRDFPQVYFPLILRQAPLQSVTSITYLDQDGTSQTWASSNYAVRTLAGVTAGRGYVETTNSTEYPATLSEASHPVTVRAVCGYGAASDIPKGILSAMYLLIGDLYSQRQETISGSTSRIQTTVRHRLSPYRLSEVV